MTVAIRGPWASIPLKFIGAGEGKIIGVGFGDIYIPIPALIGIESFNVWVLFRNPRKSHYLQHAFGRSRIADRIFVQDIKNKLMVPALIVAGIFIKLEIPIRLYMKYKPKHSPADRIGIQRGRDA